MRRNSIATMMGTPAEAGTYTELQMPPEIPIQDYEPASTVVNVYVEGDTHVFTTTNGYIRYFQNESYPIESIYYFLFDYLPRPSDIVVISGNNFTPFKQYSDWVFAVRDRSMAERIINCYYDLFGKNCLSGVIALSEDQYNELKNMNLVLPGVSFLIGYGECNDSKIDKLIDMVYKTKEVSYFI